MMMKEHEKPPKQPCKLFKWLGNKTPSFCKKHFVPKVEWQKFCSNDDKCHNYYWKMVYREKTAMNKRLEKLERKVNGITQTR